ncbi:forkhead box protein R1 isoform X1 [Paralichthys olivaceus]|uniref:forkhead box protein R1 isoform X1 n=1 Tax=Paralichthys olivaceus TaxID=8255 RepID=UPI003750D7EA
MMMMMMMKSDLSGPFLLLLLCTPAVSGFGSVLRKQYEYYRHPHSSWGDAQSFCRGGYNRDLAVIYSPTDSDDLDIKNYHAWIGLFRERNNYSTWGNWIWSNRAGTNFNAWAHWEPSWTDGCVHVDSHLISRVYGSDCGYYFFFICHKRYHGHYHYTFIPQSKTWSEAQTYCRDVFDDLSTFKKGSDLKKAVLPQDFPVWTGLHRDGGAWVWSRGLSEYRNWSEAEPSDDNGDCVSISSLGKQMSARNCSTRFPFLCYWDNLVLVKENKTWEEALEHCRALRGGNQNHELLSVQPGEEHSYVMRRVMEANSDEVWTGLRFLAGDWLWVNGAELLYSGLPVCPLEQQHCGTLSKNDTGNVRIRDCSETRNFLCYF